MEAPAPFKYRGFLSYSHHDASWARWLHRAIEGYHVDKDLVGRMSGAGPIPKQLRPIFRDREDFSAGPSLNGATLTALEASQFLVVLCSPNAAKSKYVNEEIRWFKTMGRADRVIPIIVGGDPDDPERECFPPALRFKLGSDGTPTHEREEPIAADARPEGDGKEIAKRKVIAGLLSVELDEVVRRDQRARRRHARLRNGIIAVLLALTLASAFGFFRARYELSRNEALLDRTLQRATGLVNKTVAMSEQFGLPRNVSLAILQEAEGLFRDMSELGGETAQLQYRKAIMLTEFARNYGILGDTDQQWTRASEANRLMMSLVEKQPDNPSWQAQLSVTYEEVGSALISQGKIAAALDSFRSSLDIRDRLAAAEPNNAYAQLDWAHMHNRLGQVLATQGRIAEALARYQANLAILQQLIRANPENASWQREQSFAYFQLGDVLRMQGKLAEALDSYRNSFVIRDALVSSNNRNSTWQHDLSWSRNRIGDVLLDQGKFEEALDNHRAALAIRERLVASDSSNALWRRDILWAYSRIGDVLRSRGDLDQALLNYRMGLAVAERLAAENRSRVVGQRELSVQYSRFGDVFREQLKFADALDSYRASFTLIQRVSTADSGNSIWQCELSLRYQQIGEVLRIQGNLAEAFDNERAALVILENLVESAPESAVWQQQLSHAYEHIGDVLRDQGKLAEAADSYRASFNIRQRQAPIDSSNIAWQRDLDMISKKLTAPFVDSPYGWSNITRATCGVAAQR